MKQKSGLAAFVLFFVGLFSLFTINTFAQKADLTKTQQTPKTCTGEKFVIPSTISVGYDAFGNYLKIASLSGDDRQAAFGKLSNEQKASFFRVQFALQLVKRPNMTKEQRDFILDAISKVSADLYDTENAEKVKLATQMGQETENKGNRSF
jgi:hypothetical protein